MKDKGSQSSQSCRVPSTTPAWRVDCGHGDAPSAEDRLMRVERGKVRMTYPVGDDTVKWILMSVRKPGI